MIELCPICRGSAAAPLWHREQSPIFQFLPVGYQPVATDFCELQIVQCAACGHVYNRAFDASLPGRMYGSENLSNVPVTQGMRVRLEQTVDWIGRERLENRTVVEVGGGSGGMARSVARDARDVFVFEPSRGITQAAFRERNIILVPEMFSAISAPCTADVVICRHVLEHTIDPLGMLEEMRKVLSPDGCVYLEVPNFEFIDRHSALFDFHSAHVQYFTPGRLAALAATAGLYPSREWASDDGRDFGLLLAQTEAVRPVDNRPAASERLAARLSRRHQEYVAFLGARQDRLLLYGATWTAVAFLNAFADPPPFERVLDDNSGYAGLALYHPQMQVPVRLAEEAWLDVHGDLFICPYQHAEGITAKVRALGFEGRIHRINQDPPTTNRYGPQAASARE
jgi:2-polyprenyl-3-methyl-5-hydroxy-6-metoxy-1,4-benzoquinol methylase